MNLRVGANSTRSSVRTCAWELRSILRGSQGQRSRTKVRTVAGSCHLRPAEAPLEGGYWGRIRRKTARGKLHARPLHCSLAAGPVSNPAPGTENSRNVASRRAFFVKTAAEAPRRPLNGARTSGPRGVRAPKASPAPFLVGHAACLHLAGLPGCLCPLAGAWYRRWLKSDARYSRGPEITDAGGVVGISEHRWMQGAHTVTGHYTTLSLGGANAGTHVLNRAFDCS